MPAHTSNVPVYLAVALGYLLLLPQQLSLTIGTTNLPPYRFMLIPAVLYIIARGLRGHVRLGWVDGLVIMTSAWVCLALFMTTEAVEAFTAAAAQTTDITLAYFFGRFTIRSLRDLRIFLIMMAPGLFLIAATIVVESITHQLIIQNLFSEITGQPVKYRPDYRLGLFRAPGPFPHPILAGVFLASFLPLYVLSGIKGWPKFAGITASICSFFSISSAALLGLVAGGALIAYNWLSERIANLSWRLFFFSAGVFVFVVETATGSGIFGLIMRYAALNKQTSYMRKLIWEHGSRNVLENPWFGLGYGDWARPSWMPPSVDNFWLLMAMRFGIIPAVLILIVTIWAVVMLMRAANASLSYVDRRAYKGLAISLGVFALGIISVALWLSAHVWFFMLIGLAVSVSTAVPPIPLHPLLGSTSPPARLPHQP